MNQTATPMTLQARAADRTYGGNAASQVLCERLERDRAELAADKAALIAALETIAGNHYESAQYARDLARATLARVHSQDSRVRP